TVMNPWLMFSGWTDNELCTAVTSPLMWTSRHCRPTSPKPPSLNWVREIRPLLVASLLTERGTFGSPVAGVEPADVAGVVAAAAEDVPAPGAPAGCEARTLGRSTPETVIGPMLLRSGWTFSPLVVVATRPPTPTFHHWKPRS